MKILLVVSSILFIIMSSWSLYTYNKLGEVDPDTIEGTCGVKSSSVKDGKNFSLIMLIASITVFVIIVGNYFYSQTGMKLMKYGKMSYAF